MSDEDTKYSLKFSQLEEKYSKLSAFAQENDIDVSAKLTALELEMDEEKKSFLKNLTPWQRITIARHPKRPYALDYIKVLSDDFLELKGDRVFGDDKAIIGGFATFSRHKVMVLAHQKGRDIQERNERNFGMAQPEGYRKALRLMRLAQKANVPIISFIDTPGAYPGIGSEERHVGEAIAVNLREMFTITVPIIAVIIGEGGSGGALGLGVGNRVLIMENAYYSVISPEGCASILWKDGTLAPEATEAMKITSKELLKLGIVDEVIKEPEGGGHNDIKATIDNLGKVLETDLNVLCKYDKKKLLRQRYDRFRALGEFSE